MSYSLAPNISPILRGSLWGAVLGCGIWFSLIEEHPYLWADVLATGAGSLLRLSDIMMGAVSGNVPDETFARESALMRAFAHRPGRRGAAVLRQLPQRTIFSSAAWRLCATTWVGTPIRFSSYGNLSRM
jgi:hypothetical protein